jgi:hypothetical protein
MPVPPPVMTAILPAKSFIGICPWSNRESRGKSAVGRLAASGHPVGRHDTGLEGLDQSYLRKAGLDYRVPGIPDIFLALNHALIRNY